MTPPFHYGLSRIRFRATDRAQRAIDRALGVAPEILGTVFTEFDAARILAAAAAVDGDARRADGPLAGVTVSIKDLYDEAGVTTSAGSRILIGNPPAKQDAEAVRRLKAAGAVPCGRTTMSEFAYSGLGLNPHYGHPGNARDAKRITGGSSSGSALSVTLGIVDVALGSDTGGSIRIPAALNGLAGFKPTRTSVPTDGMFPLSRRFDSAGPIARNIDMCAAVYAVLSGTAPQRVELPARPRVGIVRDPFCTEMDAQVTADLERSLVRLKEDGWQVEEVSLPVFRDYGKPTRILVSSEAYAFHSPCFAALETQGDRHILERIRAGGAYGPAEIDEAAEKRQRAIEEFAEHGRQFDAFLMPTVQVVAPLIADAEANFDRVNPFVLRNSSAVNYVDGCAATVPMQGNAQLATGLTLFAPGGRDWQILALAKRAEGLFRENS